MKEHLALLGLKVKDKVTGFTGIVTSVAFDLYGCVMAVIVPEVTDGKEKAESGWFDTKRLAILDKQPVMEQPTFDVVPGGESKPLPPTGPG